MHVRTLQIEQMLPQPIESVFRFFSDVGNLDVITPPWLHFRILTPDVNIQLGAVIEYRLRWRGIPLFWRTEISVWEPPFRFVDRALKSPYRQWVHEHTFEERDGGTLMRDRVDYVSPGWIFEPLVSSVFVKPDVERIFAYRRDKMRELFGVAPVSG